MKKQIYLFLFLFLSINLISISNFGRSDIHSYDGYQWHGDLPSICNISPANNSQIVDSVVDVNWNWWDEYSSGFGYVRTMNISVGETTIYNVDYSSREVNYWINKPPFEHIINFTKNITIDFEYLNITIDSDVVISFYILVFIDGYNHYSANYQVVRSEYVLKYVSEIIEPVIIEYSYLPYAIIGFGGIIVVMIIKSRRDYRITEEIMKREKRNIE